ncbi:hypothetical protein [Dinoroseobacter sp. S76]|uniref:hypothetical protein n=1 Tax=Dinoroseobacter sp. S76 TaxID=3415124 RepID=UPI003C7BEB28
MNWDQIQSEWSKIKNRIQATSRLNARAAADRNQWQSLLEAKYGAAAPVAEKELQTRKAEG